MPSSRAGSFPRTGADEFPNNASPYYSLPSFLVREGNPKNIKDWNDLVRDDVKVIFPNPKTSGNLRYTYLAATAFAREAFGGDEVKVDAFITKLFDNVPVFDTGGPWCHHHLVERNIGDVLITFEAETKGIAKEFGEDKFDTVTPSVSILAEFPVGHCRSRRRQAPRLARFGQDLSRFPLLCRWPAHRRRPWQPRLMTGGQSGVCFGVSGHSPRDR